MKVNSAKRAKAAARLRSAMHGSRASCAAIVGIIEAVENRCMAADGPVTSTLREMTEGEMRTIYRLAKRGAQA